MLVVAATMRQAVDEVNGLVRGQLTVGMVTAWGMVTACTVAALFDALSAFHLGYPAFGITLAGDHSGRLVERVRAGTAGLALIGAADELPEGVDGLTVSAHLDAGQRGRHAERARPGLEHVTQPRTTGISLLRP